VLSSSFSKGDALLDRSRHGAGELRGGVAQWIIPGGYSGVYARFQIAQPAQRADDPPADLLEHGGNVGVGRGLALEKAWRAPLVGAIEIDPFQEEQVIVDIEETLSTTPCRPP